MVIRGNTRGNGVQLGKYLLAMNDNHDIQILEVAGRRGASDDYLHQTIFGMQLNSELTRSDKGLYHAQINPAASEAAMMTPEDWYKAADILGKELSLEDQRRIIVLHEKKGRTHAHVVWERYDHDTGIVVSDSFSRLAQDRARKTMEQVFNHTPTPHRNKHRPEMKAALSEIWSQTQTGAEFIIAADQAGYMVAAGSMRHPFMIVDENGRTFDLVRQLTGTRIKEVRERMKGETLTPEKEAIELMRNRNTGNSGKGKQTATTFTANRLDMFEEAPKLKTAKEYLSAEEDITTKQPEEEPSKAQQVAAAFAENNNLEQQAEIERERRKQEMIAEQKAAELKRKLKRGQRYVILLMVSFNLNFRSYSAKLDQFIANKDMITTTKPVAEVRPLDQFRLN